MEIKNVTTYASQATQKTQESAPRNRAEEKDSGVKETAQQKDRVQLSGKYQEMNNVKKVTMELDDIRTERVDQLRAQIKNDSYLVDPEKIAEKMLEEMW